MRALWLLGVGLLPACLPVPPPAQALSEIARDVNVATRFGRMDVAMEHLTKEHREEFSRQRADWGHEIRVLDVELAQLDVKNPKEAKVLVDVSWMRMDEGLLRSTRVTQNWENSGSGWELGAEERQGGDLGLLGEDVVVLHPVAPHDAHFPVTTIR
jgi:hypothetical protein